MRPLIVENELVDRVLHQHRQALGVDFDGYRNHVYRVVNFFNALGPSTFDSIPSLAVAAAFHDLGIWVHRTFDYLDPSVELAQRFMEAELAPDMDAELVREVIVSHHKITQYREGLWASLVEQWRRADLVDVSLGLIRHGIPRTQIREIQHSLPNRGFHKRLMTLTAAQLVRTPWNPLPMMRW